MIGRLINAYRDSYDLTVVELSKTIGVPIQVIHRLEKGKAVSDYWYAEILRWIITNPDAKHPREHAHRHDL